MADDWEWFWAGESGRDNLLRSEVEGAHQEARRASSQAARLSSQLAQVQGSMETRLSALATAFDAYVELGDIREQLAAYPDTSAVRRNATAALEVLTRGGVPEPLDDQAPGYWLVDAINAVIARSAGRQAAEAEARAATLDRDAELFIVAAAGALGQGAQVGDRVAPLLITDGELSPAQQALWAAVLAGDFGDVLPAVREPWTPALGGSDVDWRAWAKAQARTSTPLETLRWIERQVAASEPGATAAGPAGSDGPVAAADLLLARPATETSGPAEQATARTALGTVVLTLIQRGQGDEVALLERARELRAKIEQPEKPVRNRSVDRADGAPPTATVLTAVRTAFLAATPGSAQRAELLTWVQRGLGSAVDRCATDAEAIPPEMVPARTPGGTVEVYPPGVTADQREQAEKRVRDHHAAPPRSTLLVPAIAAVGFLVTTVLAGALGSSTLAVLAGLAAVAAVVVVLRALLNERRRQQNLRNDLARTGEVLGQTEARARELESARLDTFAEAGRLAAGLRDRLRTPVG